MVKKALGYIGFVLLLWLAACNPDEPLWNTQPTEAMATKLWNAQFKMAGPGPRVTFVEPSGCVCAEDGQWHAEAFTAANGMCVNGIYDPNTDAATVSRPMAWGALPHELMHARKMRLADDPDVTHAGFSGYEDIHLLWERAWIQPAEDALLAMLRGDRETVVDR